MTSRSLVWFVMDEFAAGFADRLESIATKIRSMTVDRVDRILTIVAIGIVATVLALVALIFLTVALFRILANYTTVEGAYAILGGLFVIAGAFVWAKRNSEQDLGSG